MKRLINYWEKGFTLSELLIAVAILGLIAALAIPKVLVSVETQQKKAIFKETIADLHQVLVESVNSGRGSEASFAYMSSKMNATKLCPTDGIAEGCISTGPEFGQPSFVLPNGAVVGGFDVGYTIGTGNGLMIDWNGNRGSNTLGDDQLWLSWVPPTLKLLPMYLVTPATDPTNTSVPLYNSIFSSS